MISKTKLNRYITVIILILVSFVMVLAMCNKSIGDVKLARDEQTVDVRKRDFEIVWNVLEMLHSQANSQTETVATNIEHQIRNSFDLDELQAKLDEDDPIYTEKLYKLISNCVSNVHLNDIQNNRNSMIVLEGYDTIVEDLLVDPDSREKGADIKDPNSNSLYKYRDTTYNKEMFDTAMRKIRNHSDSSIIAIEPYNYISSNKDHQKIKEATYNTLEEVYVNEGIDGLRNYQFLVPVYITDTGDIFGQADTVQGIKVDNHKFIVIQTFNLYDQLISYKPDFGDDDYLHRLNIRCDNILNSLYILGIVVCILIVFIILYFLSIYNALIEKNSQIHDIVKEIEEEKIKET